MDESVMKAYTEVDKILSLMDEKFQNKVPKKLRELISKNKLSDYNVNINFNISLNEQNISKKALAILAVLNYNYWQEEDKKQELIKKYKNNEAFEIKKINEKYNTNNIFYNNTRNAMNNIENTKMVIYNPKENFIKKLINKIKNKLRIN